MFYKCGGCLNFFWLTLVSFASCNRCQYMAIRCDGCGGQDAAHRSVALHVGWYTGKSGIKAGYRKIHDEKYHYKPKSKKKNAEKLKAISKYVPRTKMQQVYLS